jgi:uncharacterized damage-inducible protein DinB
MDRKALIESYAAGPRQLREAVAGMSRSDLLAHPIPGRWNTLQVVCHLADFEPVYADRMKRVLAEEKPLLLAGDPNQFAARLAYDQRDLEEELAVVEATRRQMVRILNQLSADDFARVGQHSVDGPISLEELLTRIAKHVPHHLQFIEEKRQALARS